MRTTFIILIPLFVIAVFASAPVSHAQVPQKGVTVESSTGDSGGTIPAGREIKGNKYAVLVGVTEYQHMPHLRFTKNDAEALRDQLIARGFAPDNIRTLINGGGGTNEPTKQNIENAVQETLHKAGQDDLVVLFLSGHGTQPDRDPLFCPPEADRRNLPNTTVSINDIRDHLGNSKASFKLLIVDACRDNNPFSAAVETPQRNAGARTIFVNNSTSNANVLGFKGVTLESVDTEAPLRNLTVFQSCSRGQLSWEDGKLNHGIFTHFIVEGLRGNAADKRGDITMDGLLTYAITETPYHAESLQREQNPWRMGEGNNFILANIHRPNQPSPPPRPPQPPQPPRSFRRITALDLPQQPSELPTIPSGSRRINVATTRELLDAVDPKNLKDGDVIVLKSGTYTLPNSLNITGRHPLDKRTGETIVLYGDPRDPENVKIRIRNGRINITRDTLVELIGLDISSANGEGVQVDGEAEVGILFCSIHDCKGSGIRNGAHVAVDSSVITGNGDGFFTSGKSYVNNCRIEYNKKNGVTVSRSAKGRFSDNILFDNGENNWRVLGAVQN